MTAGREGAAVEGRVVELAAIMTEADCASSEYPFTDESRARAVIAAGWVPESEVREREAAAAALARRATLDPGAFTKRGPDNDGNEYGEPIDRWQTRAIEAALARAERIGRTE